MTTDPFIDNDAGRLSDLVGSLQDGSRKLSKATTLKDLIHAFAEVVRSIFPASDLEVLMWSAGSGQWQSILHPASGTVGEPLPLPPRAATSSWEVDESAGVIRVVQKLSDGAAVGVVVGRGHPGAGKAGEDVVFLRLFTELFARVHQEMLSRHHEKELVFSLNHRVLQLTSLIDTGIEVARLDQGTSPQELALQRAVSLTNASKGVMRVTHDGALVDEIFFPTNAANPSPNDHGRRITTEFSFAGKTFTFELVEKESRKGYVPFEETDQLLLDALARQVHASLENRYLHQQALEKQKIEQEIAVAASIQQRILPTTLPQIPGYDIAGINIPSKSVGGDYFDCIALPDGKYALVIADVAGKGVPAALLVSSLHAYLSAYLESPFSLVGLARRLNTVICRASTDDKFITAFIALLSPESGTLESLCAAHNPAYLLKSDGTLQELSTGGVALGMLEMDFPYQTDHATLCSGDRLLLYTDGVTEATNEAGQQYDAHSPLPQFLARHSPARSPLFIQELISDLKQFTGTAPQNDDITALYLRRR
jgi:sigma-B regulation protein RsbU (phosphoserine phosphatase)